MTPKREETTEYEDILEDAKALTKDVAPSGDYSLEEVLAEYGESRAQHLLHEVEAAQEVKSAGEKPGVSDQGAAAESAPAGGTGGVAAGGGRTSAAGQQPAAQIQEPPGSPSASPELPPAPQPISLEELVGHTVDAVMDEQVRLPEKKRRWWLFSRKPMPETEELYQRARSAPTGPLPAGEPEPPEAEAEIGPELPLETVAAKAKARLRRARQALPWAALATAALSAVRLAEEKGYALPLWSGDMPVQAAVELSFLLAVSLLCRSVFAQTVRALRARSCPGSALAVLAAITAGADCALRPFLSARTDTPPYVLAACGALTFALWGELRLQRARYDTCRAASLTEEPPYLITDTPEGACKQSGRVRGFYTDFSRRAEPLAWQSAIVPVILTGTLVFAGLSSLGQRRGQDFLLCWSAILAASASCALPLSWALPWSNLAARLQKDGCALAGWSGAESVSRRKTILVTDADLFPPGAVRLNGIKVFGEEVPHAVSYAASLVRESACGLCRLFDGLLRSEDGAYCPVDDFSFYEEGGLSGTIRGESVLLGTASFMRKMEVRLPGNLNLRTGLFLAVDRRLSAVFAVKYHASENVDWALHLLRRCHITAVLAARDPNITPALLQRKFNGRIRVEYPPLAVRVALSEQERGRGLPHALLLREGLAPYAEAVCGGRRLCRAARFGTALSLLGSAAGTLLAYYLTLSAEFALLTPLSVLVFLLLWTVPTILAALRCGQV